MEVERPSWDDYFMGIAFVVSLRSCDVQTQHGCVLVDPNNHIIGTGYNSFPRGMDDKSLPNTRPDKYRFMRHSEANAISNCCISPWLFPSGVKAYITGQPCNPCAQLLWQNNVTVLNVAKRKGTELENEETQGDFDRLVNETGMVVNYMDYDNSWIGRIL